MRRQWDSRLNEPSLPQPFYIRNVNKKILHSRQKLKSMSLLVPIEKVKDKLGEMNFSLIMISTIVADGKFWKKGLYTNGEDTIHVSHEIGDAYPKDPIITICGCNETISRVVEEMLDIAIV
jgi:hypothetical protein